MKSVVLAAISAALLGGCVSTTEQADAVLRSEWLGKNADAFFSRHGLPSKQYASSSGGRFYEWADQRAVSLPGYATTTVSPSYGGTFFAQTIYTAPSSIRVACTVTIEADKANVIRAIRATGDTIGNWQLSRCAEIFRAS